MTSDARHNDKADGQCRTCEGPVPEGGYNGNLFYCSERCRIVGWNKHHPDEAPLPIPSVVITAPADSTVLRTKLEIAEAALREIRRKTGEGFAWQIAAAALREIENADFNAWLDEGAKLEGSGAFAYAPDEEVVKPYYMIERNDRGGPEWLRFVDRQTPAWRKKPYTADQFETEAEARLVARIFCDLWGQHDLRITEHIDIVTDDDRIEK